MNAANDTIAELTTRLEHLEDEMRSVLAVMTIQAGAAGQIRDCYQDRIARERDVDDERTAVEALISTPMTDELRRDIEGLESIVEMYADVTHHRATQIAAENGLEVDLEVWREKLKITWAAAAVVIAGEIAKSAATAEEVVA